MFFYAWFLSAKFGVYKNVPPKSPKAGFFSSTTFLCRCCAGYCGWVVFLSKINGAQTSQNRSFVPTYLCLKLWSFLIKLKPKNEWSAFAFVSEGDTSDRYLKNVDISPANFVQVFSASGHNHKQAGAYALVSHLGVFLPNFYLFGDFLLRFSYCEDLLFPCGGRMSCAIQLPAGWKRWWRDEKAQKSWNRKTPCHNH